jgi:hypothetical protein
MKTVCDVNSDANKKVEIKDLRLGEAVLTWYKYLVPSQLPFGFSSIPVVSSTLLPQSPLNIDRHHCETINSHE